MFDLAKIRKEFRAEGPFPNAVIDNVFPEWFVNELANEARNLEDDGKWFIYRNPLEVKDAREELPPMLKNVAQSLQTSAAIGLLSSICGFPLLGNPDLRGAGLHRISSGGKLDIHLDHNIYKGMERKLNLIYWFHDEDWKDEWGGHLELWSGRDGKPYECVRRIKPKRNRMALFECSENSFHGHPDPLKCPAGVCRTSLALYYYTPILSGAPERPRVNFYPRPSDPSDPVLDELREKRARGESVYR